MSLQRTLKYTSLTLDLDRLASSFNKFE